MNSHVDIYILINEKNICIYFLVFTYIYLLIYHTFIYSYIMVATATGGKDQATAMVGGLRNASSADAALQRVTDALGRINIDGVIDTYHKTKSDDQSNGVVFVKFGSVEKRDVAIKAFTTKQESLPDFKTFIGEDLLVQQRAIKSFLLGLKRLLIEWELQNISFEVDSGILSVGGLPVLRTVVDGFTLT